MKTTSYVRRFLVMLCILVGITVSSAADEQEGENPREYESFLAAYGSDREAALNQWFANPAKLIENIEIVKALAETTPEAGKIIKDIVHKVFSSGPHPKREEALGTMAWWCSEGLEKGTQYIPRKDLIPIWESMVHVLPFTRCIERENRFIETLVRYAGDADPFVRKEASKYFSQALADTDRFNTHVEKFRRQATRDCEVLASRGYSGREARAVEEYVNLVTYWMGDFMKRYSEQGGAWPRPVTEEEYFSFRALPFEQQLEKAKSGEVYKLILRDFFSEYNFDITKIDAYLDAFFKHKEISLNHGRAATDDMGFLARQLMDSIFEKGNTCPAMQTLNWFIDHLCSANSGDKPLYTPEVFAQSVDAILYSYCKHKQAAKGSAPFTLDPRVEAICLQLLSSPVEAVRHCVWGSLELLNKVDPGRRDEMLRSIDEKLKNPALSPREKGQLEDLRKSLFITP